MSSYDSIDEALNVESSIVGLNPDKTAIEVSSKSNDIQKDYEYTLSLIHI